MATAAAGGDNKVQVVVDLGCGVVDGVCIWVGCVGFLLDRSVIHPLFVSFFDPPIHPSIHPTSIYSSIPSFGNHGLLGGGEHPTSACCVPLQGDNAVVDGSPRGRACWKCS